ncbi:MAG: O-methyltransferase [Bacteroidales bacterium]|jgi:predicted O-methyltransferase YrrM|nr:O-methyltransferase [Bacteroidales bacterium]
MESPLEKYIEIHSSFRNEALDWLERQTNIRTNYPRMLTGKVQGEFLYMMTRMISPRNVLEIGTFTGYSAICMALALEGEGHIDTLEINDELEDLILEGFERAGVSGRVSLHIGDAVEFLRGQDGKKLYDLTFIDANKREYPDYYELALTLTRPGGFILADDVLWDGKVYAEQVPTDKQTSGIVRFNDLAASDPRVETVILPVRHGLSIIRKK